MKERNVLIIGMIIFVICATGWVKNLIKLSKCDFEKPYTAEVIHTVGIFPGIGAVTGWFDLGK